MHACVCVCERVGASQSVRGRAWAFERGAPCHGRRTFTPASSAFASCCMRVGVCVRVLWGHCGRSSVEGARGYAFARVPSLRARACNAHQLRNRVNLEQIFWDSASGTSEQIETGTERRASEGEWERELRKRRQIGWQRAVARAGGSDEGASALSLDPSRDPSRLDLPCTQCHAPPIVPPCLAQYARTWLGEVSLAVCLG
jgi:hypothetical protein